MSVFNTTRLFNKNVLVTGASSGIGAETAILFAKAGANVVLSARRQNKLLEVLNTCKEVHQLNKLQQGGQFHSVDLDVSDKDSVESLFDRLPIKNIDILVNNAGLVKGLEEVGGINDDDIDIMFNTNVKGLIKLTQLFVNHFKENNSGHVINVGSIAGLEPYPKGSIYCATKHAIRAFGNSLLKELVGTPIRVSEIQPGLVETEFSVVRFRGDKEKADKVYEGLDPLTPQDIAEEIVWTASRPPHVNIANSLIFPTHQASATTVARPGKSNN